MRVFAIVNAYTGALCLQELVDQDDEVVGVVTDPGDPDPRQPLAASVRRTADRNYLPVYQPPVQEVNSDCFIALIRGLAPDLIVSMHYPLIFRPELLAVPRLGCVNEHPSRLPAGRGMTPSWWHMLVGDGRNWITLHYLDPGIDTGDVIAQGSVEIAPDDTGHTTSHKLSEEGHRIFARSLPLIRDGVAPRTPQKQIEGVTPSYYSWKPWMAAIDWGRSAAEIALLVRCLNHPKDEPSWTGCAYTGLAGRRIDVWAAQAVNGPTAGAAVPGQVLAVTGQGLLVKAGEGAVLLTDLDVAGAGEPGIPGLLPLLPAGLPAIFS